MRHIPEGDLGVKLRAGRTLAQLLPPEQRDGRRILHYVELSHDRHGFVLIARAVWDEGDDNFCDLGEFPDVAEEEELDEEFGELDDALAAAAEYGARPDRWVEHGVLGDEYRDLRAAE